MLAKMTSPPGPKGQDNPFPLLLIPKSHKAIKCTKHIPCINTGLSQSLRIYCCNLYENSKPQAYQTDEDNILRVSCSMTKGFDAEFTFKELSAKHFEDTDLERL